MEESESIAQVVRILRKIPHKSLRIVELLNQIPIKGGELDVKVLQTLMDDIDSAKKEAMGYRQATETAISALWQLRDKDTGLV